MIVASQRNPSSSNCGTLRGSSTSPERDCHAQDTQRIITIANQRAASANDDGDQSGDSPCRHGQRVLIVDLDPQGNASTGLGIQRRDRKMSSYDLMIGQHCSIRNGPGDGRGLTCPSCLQRSIFLVWKWKSRANRIESSGFARLLRQARVIRLISRRLPTVV